MRIPRWIQSWLFGALTGVVLLSVMGFSPIAFPLAIAALFVIVVRSAERAAFGGGAFVPTGLWFLYSLRGAVERCAEMDRSPTGGCSIYGVEEQAVAMGLYCGQARSALPKQPAKAKAEPYGAVGVGLTLYAASRRRSRASADPSAAVPRHR